MKFVNEKQHTGVHRLLVLIHPKQGRAWAAVQSLRGLQGPRTPDLCGLWGGGFHPAGPQGLGDADLCL